jgi:hypothetical protein
MAVGSLSSEQKIIIMNLIEVKQEIFSEQIPEMKEVSRRLDLHGRGHTIDNVNWKEFGYKPGVRFNIAYSTREILLKYYVKEDHFRAEKTESNQMVCEDSCVEFFVSPAEDGVYYNFEFNAIATCLMGSGKGRSDSKVAPVEVIAGIRRLTSGMPKTEKEISGNILWDITIAIPYEVFFHHKVTNLRGKSFKANFYKCGDKLSVPHYITWNPVGTSQPDYHRPEYFGLLKFI